MRVLLNWRASEFLPNTMKRLYVVRGGDGRMRRVEDLARLRNRRSSKYLDPNYRFNNAALSRRQRPILSQLFDPKLESLKGGVYGERHPLFGLDPDRHRFTGCRYLSQVHIAKFAEPTAGISSIGLGTTNHPTLHGV
jgi:hypothetical protein